MLQHVCNAATNVNAPGKVSRNALRNARTAKRIRDTQESHWFQQQWLFSRWACLPRIFRFCHLCTCRFKHGGSFRRLWPRVVELHDFKTDTRILHRLFFICSDVCFRGCSFCWLFRPLCSLFSYLLCYSFFSLPSHNVDSRRQSDYRRHAEFELHHCAAGRKFHTLPVIGTIGIRLYCIGQCLHFVGFGNNIFLLLYINEFTILMWTISACFRAMWQTENRPWTSSRSR